MYHCFGSSATPNGVELCPPSLQFSTQTHTMLDPNRMNKVFRMYNIYNDLKYVFICRNGFNGSSQK